MTPPKNFGENPTLTHLPIVSSSPDGVSVLDKTDEHNQMNAIVVPPSLAQQEMPSYAENAQDVREVISSFVRELSAIETQVGVQKKGEKKDIEIAKKSILESLRHFLRDIHHPILEHVHFDEVDAYVQIRKAKEGKKQGSIIKKAEHLRNSGKISDDVFQSFLRALKEKEQFTVRAKDIGIPKTIAEELYFNRGAALADQSIQQDNTHTLEHEGSSSDVGEYEAQDIAEAIAEESFHPGEYVILDGKEYETIRLLGGKAMELEDLDTKRVVVFPFSRYDEGVQKQKEKDEQDAIADASRLVSPQPQNEEASSEIPDASGGESTESEMIPPPPLFSAREMEDMEKRSREQMESIVDRGLRVLYENHGAADFRDTAVTRAFLNECASVFSALGIPAFTLSRFSFGNWKKNALKHVEKRPLPVQTRYLQFALTQIEYIYQYFKEDGALSKLAYRDGNFETEPKGIFNESKENTKTSSPGVGKNMTNRTIEDDGLVRVEEDAKEKDREREKHEAENIVRSFAEKVGLTPDMFSAIRGFSELPYGKQLLVLQDYEEVAFRKARDEGRREGERTYAKMHWVKHLTLGFVKQKGIHEEQQRLLRDALSTSNSGKTYEQKIAELQALVLLAGECPDARIENGVAVPELLSQTDESLRAFITAYPDVDPTHIHNTLRAYNDAASVCAVYSHSEIASVRFEKEQDRESLAGRLSKKKGFTGTLLRIFTSEKEGVSAAETAESVAAYEKSKEELLSLLLGDKVRVGEPTQDEITRKELALRIIESADQRMALRQSIAVGGATESALASMKNDTALWSMTKEFWGNKGKYMALGSVVRISAGVALGAVASPIASGLLASLGSAYFRRKREMREILQRQRQEVESGMVADREVSEQVLDYSKITKGLFQRADAIVQKLKSDESLSEAEKAELEQRYEMIKGELEKYQQKLQKGSNYEILGPKKIREYRDAEFFIARMEQLEKRINSEELSEDQKNLAQKKMVETAALMRELHARGKIHYGTNGRREVALTKELTLINKELSLLEQKDISEFQNILQGWSGDRTAVLYDGMTVEDMQGKGEEELLTIRQAMLEKEKIGIVTRLAEFTHEHAEAAALLRRKDFARYLIVADTYQQVDRKKLEEHFGTLLNDQLKDIDAVRSKRIKREARKGAIVAAVSSVVGASLTHLVREWLADDAVVAAGTQVLQSNPARGAVPPPLPRAAIEAELGNQGNGPSSVVSAEETVREPVVRVGATKSVPPPVPIENTAGAETVVDSKGIVAGQSVAKGTMRAASIPPDAEQIEIPKSSPLPSNTPIEEPVLAQEIPPDPVEVEVPKEGEIPDEGMVGSADESIYSERMTLENVQEYTDVARDASPQLLEDVPLESDISSMEIQEPEVVPVPSPEETLRNSVHQTLEHMPQQRIIVLPPAEQVAMSGQVREEMDGVLKKIFQSRFPAFFRAIKTDPMSEWNGNQKIGLVGIKQLSAEDFAQPNRSLMLESHGRAEIRKYITGLRDTTGIQPNKQETIGRYIERALTEKAIAEKHLGTGLLDATRQQMDVISLAREAKTVSVEEGVLLQQAWDAKSVSEKLIETPRLLPRLIRTDLSGVTDEVRFPLVLENFKRHPARLLEMSSASLRKIVDEDTYRAIERIQDLVRKNHLPPYSHTMKDKFLKDYLEQAYRVRLMQNGPLGIVARSSR